MNNSVISKIFPPKAEIPGTGRHNGANLNQTWIITYLDTFTLMLVFFIILNSANDHSLQNKPLPPENQPQNLASLQEVMEDRLLLNLLVDLTENLQNDIDARIVRLERLPYEIKLSYGGSSFFGSGSSVLLPQGSDIIARTVKALASIQTDQFFIDIEGHTDSLPIRTEAFPTNWELSTARAAAIVRFFLDQGFPKTSLKASGYADTFLLVPDYDEGGRAIPTNNDINRRIVFRIYANRSYLQNIAQQTY
jgi:chemotaxis protein MotB